MGEVLHLGRLSLQLLAALVLLVVALALLAVALYLMVVIARDHPWAALAALPLIAVYAWAAWASSPAFGWRVVIAVSVQTLTLLSLHFAERLFG